MSLLFYALGDLKIAELWVQLEAGILQNLQ